MKERLLKDVLGKMSYLPQNDLELLKNTLSIVLNDYDVYKAKNEIMEWNPEENYRLLRLFLIAKKVQGCTDRTIEYYRQINMHFLEELHVPLCETKTEHIRYYIANREIRDHVTKCTQNNERRCISSFFNWLTKEEYIKKNPMLKLEMIRQPKKKKEAFTDIEVEKMRAELETGYDKAIFEVLLSTGCRVTELCNIKVEDIKNDEVLVHGKGQKDRIVYLNAKALVAVENYIKERNDENPFLFPGAVGLPERVQGNRRRNEKYWYKEPRNINESHVDVGTVEGKIRKLGKKLNIRAHPHKFRRTCATRALLHGMPLMSVSKMLGHENVGTTQIYLDLNNDELKAAHKKYVV